MEASRPTKQPLRVVGMILIFAGIIMLAYGGFEYANERGRIENSAVADTSTFGDREVSLPIFGGIVSLAIGAILLYSARGQATNFPITPHTTST